MDLLTGAEPPGFADAVAAGSARLAEVGLAEFVREDIVACGERFELVPTVGRYAGFVDPVRDEAAAREIAHQVVAAARADRDKVVAAIADRHPAWAQHLRQASVALDLLGGRESERLLPDSVGPQLESGEQRFAVLDVLAMGGQGTVATAIDRASTRERDDDRVVAVKFLRARSDESEPWNAEAARASAVLHPCGIRVLWSGQVRGTLGCVVFERIVGRSLVSLRAAEEPLDLDLFAAELTDLALALAELHDRGSAHGDLSPANVLVDAFGRMRLVDYGLSRPITAELRADDVVRLAELVQWIVLGFVPPVGASVPRRLGLAGRLLRAAADARARPPEATEFAAALSDCVQKVHWARGWLEIIAAASVLFALLAMVREGYL